MSEQGYPLPSTQHCFALSTEARTAFQELATLADHYPLHTAQPEKRHEQVVTYYDTAGYQLLRTGLAVRLVQEQEQTLLHVENLASGLLGKVDKQISRRPSVTAPLPTCEAVTTLKAWPKPVREAVAAVVGRHAQLQPILVLQCQRTIHTVSETAVNGHTTRQPDPLAQLTLATVTIGRPTQEESQPNATTVGTCPSFGQMTVEFAATGWPEEASAASQERITTWLTMQPGIQPITSSTQHMLEQALLVTSRYAPGQTAVAGLHPQMVMLDACRMIWHEQLILLLTNEAGVRYSQDREYVHEMRVAIRRMRAAAKLYRHYLPQKLMQPYLVTLRKTGRLLGEIRNLDVTLLKANRHRDQDGQKVKTPKKLLKAWRQQRQVAQQKLLDWLDSSYYSDFVTELFHFCTALASPDKHHRTEAVTAKPRQVRHVIPAQIFAGYAAVRCYETLFEATTPADYTAFHNLRIACKYLRYNLEFVRHLLGEESAALISDLKELQDRLGDLNDAVIAQALVDEVKPGRHQADPYQQVLGQRMAELSQQVPAMLATLTAPEYRRQLATVLAHL